MFTILLPSLLLMCSWVQDEVRVLVRVNGIYFTTGYLGFLTSWILDTIHT